VRTPRLLPPFGPYDQSSLYLLDLESGELSRVTSQEWTGIGSTDDWTALSYDGLRLARGYASTSDCGTSCALVQDLLPRGPWQMVPSRANATLSGDGAWLGVVMGQYAQPLEAWVKPLDGGLPHLLFPRRWASTTGDFGATSAPLLSFDATRFAFVSTLDGFVDPDGGNNSGWSTVYAGPIPDGGHFIAMGLDPSLSSDGHLIAYDAADGITRAKCVVADVDTGEPVPMLPLSTGTVNGCVPRLSGDGKRLLVDVDGRSYLIPVPR
jgi:hypothetical protein